MSFEADTETVREGLESVRTPHHEMPPYMQRDQQRTNAQHAALDRLVAEHERLREGLRTLLSAAGAEVGAKTTTPDKDAEYWAGLDLAVSMPGVDRRILLARAVLAARDLLAALDRADELEADRFPRVDDALLPDSVSGASWDPVVLTAAAEAYCRHEHDNDMPVKGWVVLTLLNDRHRLADELRERRVCLVAARDDLQRILGAKTEDGGLWIRAIAGARIPLVEEAIANTDAALASAVAIEQEPPEDFVRYCCGDPDCPNDCEREVPPDARRDTEASPVRRGLRNR